MATVQKRLPHTGSTLVHRNVRRTLPKPCVLLEAVPGRHTSAPDIVSKGVGTPGTHLAGVVDVAHDLGDVYNWLLENDMEASNLASMGRNLALSMSVSSAYCVFKRAFEKVSFT